MERGRYTRTVEKRFCGGLTGSGGQIKTMVCKNCKRAIDDDSIFCKWCGERQIRERKKKGEVKVPKPRQLASGKWFAQVMVDGTRVPVSGDVEMGGIEPPQ